MLSQTTVVKPRDLEGAGAPVRPSLRLVPDINVRRMPVIDLSTISALPDRRVCLGCRSFRCSTPGVCTRVVASMVLTPCVQCRGVGAVCVDGPGGGFVDCDPCDGLGLVTADGAVVEIGGAA